VLPRSQTDRWEQDLETVGFAQDFDGQDEVQDTRSSPGKTYHKPETPLRVWFEYSSCGSTLLRLVVCTFALWGCVDVVSRAVHSLSNRLQTETPACWCGTTDEQAVAMGCHYDHLAVDWLPESCIDKDLVIEFDASGPGADGAWPYYDVGNSTKAMGGSSGFVPINNTDIEDFARAGRWYFATREWHILHCMFTWRKQFRARFDASNVEPWNNHEEHIQHCSDYIMQTVRWGLSKDTVDTTILGVDRHPREDKE
jgi:hypothetical protein